MVKDVGDFVKVDGAINEDEDDEELLKKVNADTKK